MQELESTLSNKIHSVDRDGVIIHYQEHKKHFCSLHSSLSVFKIIKPEFTTITMKLFAAFAFAAGVLVRI